MMTKITIDRAKSIADNAVAAGLAEPPNRDAGIPYIFSPALKAKFTDVGVSKVAELNFDQAAEVEAFIRRAKTTRTTIEFRRVVGTDEHGDPIIETVNADVLIEGESFQVDLPAGGRWACDQKALRAALA